MHVALVLNLFAWFIAFAWLSRAIAAARGLPRIPNLNHPQYDTSPSGTPAVTVIVPACNEEAAVAACIHSLIAQDYPNLHIIAVDDRSTDSTPRILDNLARENTGRLTVLHITCLPPDWLGKPHALALGARHAISLHQPVWLLFTDADVFFRPDAIRRSLSQAVATRADHFVTAPTPLLHSIGEAALLGFLQTMALWVSRPWRVSDPRSPRDAVGIGAFNLLRTSAYQHLGGFEILRMQILEDVTLARRVKILGLRQRVAFAPGLITLHWAAGTMGLVNVMTKNLFAAFSFRPALLLAACGWLLLVCLGPIVGLAFATLRIPAILSLLSIAALFVTMSRFSPMPAWSVLALPFSVCVFVYSLLRSMFVTLRNGGVTWRGTFYPLAELRKHALSLGPGIS